MLGSRNIDQPTGAFGVIDIAKVRDPVFGDHKLNIGSCRGDDLTTIDDVGYAVGGG